MNAMKPNLSKSIYQFCLLLALVLVGAQPELAHSEPVTNSNEMEIQKRVFLLDLAKRYQAMLDINRVRLELLKKCLDEKMSPQSFSQLNISDSEAQKPKDWWISCIDASSLVKNNIKVGFPIMRQLLLLLELLKQENVTTLLDVALVNYRRGQLGLAPLSLSIESENSLFGDLQVKNPLVTWIDPHLLPMPTWRSSEISLAIDETEPSLGSEDLMNWSAVFKKVCESIIEDYRGSVRPVKINFCNEIKLFTTKENTITPILESPFSRRRDQEIATSVQVFKSFWSDAVRSDRKRIESAFFASVQNDPYVAFVRSNQPSVAEVSAAIGQMIHWSKEVIGEWEGRKASEELFNARKAKNSDLIDLMKYLPVVESLIASQGDQMKAYQENNVGRVDWRKVVEELLSEKTSKDLRVGTGQVAGVIAANIIVCWSIGALTKSGVALRATAKLSHRFVTMRAFSMGLADKKLAEKLVADVVNPFCFMAGGVIFNAGFAYHDWNSYMQVYREVFGAIAREKITINVSELSEKERAFFWTTLMSGFGTGISDGVMAYRSARAIKGTTDVRAAGIH